MPDPQLVSLPARPSTAAECAAARLTVASASLARYPQQGDLRAVWDCRELLEMLGLDHE